MKNTNDSVIVKLIKGFVIGASMLIPGVSGGTMAIILGIYDELIHAVSSLKQNFKANSVFLAQVILSALFGILLFSRPLLTAVTLWQKPMMFLFTGAIIGSIPPLYRKVKVNRIKTINIFAAFIGAFCGVMTMFLPEGLFQFSESFNFYNFIMLVIAGIILAIALVLPGISASYILLMMGMYDLTLLAIRELNLLYLFPLITGVLGGTFLTAGILEKEMQRHPQFTYMMIIGFMLGSLFQVFPGIPEEQEIVISLITFSIGFSLILWLQKATCKAR